MSNLFESDNKKTRAYYKIIHRKLWSWENWNSVVGRGTPKIEKPAWNIFHFKSLVNEMREIQKIRPSLVITYFTSSSSSRGSSMKDTSPCRWLHHCFSVIHANFIFDHLQEATKHSVLVPFCGLLLSVSVCRLPRSATSQSIWVLSCTVKWPGLAHDNGRRCVKWGNIKYSNLHNSGHTVLLMLVLRVWC